MQADLVDAEEAEPDARPEDMEPTLPSTQDGEDEAADAAEDLLAADEYKKVYNKFLTNYRRWVTSQTSELYGRALARARARFGLPGKPFAEKEKLARAFWAHRGRGKEEELERILAHWNNKESGEEKRIWLNSKSAFLTYNGSWGLLPSLPVPEKLEAGSPEELACVVQLCQSSEAVVQAWKSFQALWEELSLRDGWTEYALAFEICPNTLTCERVVRLHAHVSIRQAGRRKVNSARHYAWRGSVPHVSNLVSVGRCRTSGDNQCMYYLQSPKLGKVFSKGNIEPFHSYLVSGEWVLNLVQAGKMDVKLAREEIVKTAKNLPRHLQNLDRFVMEVREQRLRERIVQIDLEIERTEQPFKTFPRFTN